MKRSRDDIISTILTICQGRGANKTLVVYTANLNFRTVSPYLDLLIENELLEVRKNGRERYFTTEKGERALEALKQIEDMVAVDRGLPNS